MFRRTICALLLAATPLIAQEPAPPILAILTRSLAKTEDPAAQLNILRGINGALKGKRNLAAPVDWTALYDRLKASPNEEVRQQVQALAVVFGGGGALDELRKALADPAAPPAARLAALDSLVSAKDPASLATLLQLAREPGTLRAPALRGLAGYADPQVPPAITASFRTFSTEEKRDALATLLARPAWARALVEALDKGSVQRGDLSAPLARQLAGFKDPAIDAGLAKHWGSVRPASADKQAEIARFKGMLTINSLEKADPSHGRAVFTMTCAACHSLFGTGGQIGPELPGAFEDVDYLLQNIVEPNAIIGKDYQQTVVTMRDGQILTGVVSGEDQTTLTVKTLGGPLTVQRPEVAQVTLSDVSLMPDGLLSVLGDNDVRNLFAYLRRHGQVPLLLTPLNGNDFFSGTDLARWIPSRADAWRVENGEIIGHGSAARPEFLTSDMLGEDFRMRFEVRVTGANAAAEIVLRGQQGDGGFTGHALSIGSSGPACVWRYQPGTLPVAAAVKSTESRGEWVEVEITARGAHVKILLAGKVAFEASDLPGAARTVPAFYVHGDGAEVRVKGITLEILNADKVAGVR